VRLIVLDGELPRPPRRVVHLLDERHAVPLQCLGHGGGVVRLEVQVEVPARVDERDRRVLLVGELQVKDLAAGADARVGILVLEL
jgi:hypothetical protein